MTCLLYHTTCPSARTAKLLLYEKNVTFESEIISYWDGNKKLKNLNPASELPILIHHNDVIISLLSIIRFITYMSDDVPNWGRSLQEIYESNRLFMWISTKFHYEVSMPIIQERILCFYKSHTPQSHIIRSAKSNLSNHLKYFNYLLDKRSWFVGDNITFVDLVVGAHLSILDYLGEIYWDYFPNLKSWYAIIKSRPSFQNILSETIPGFKASIHYTNLDF